ncbi:phage holin family protein [Streptomyces sp. NPDC054887]
MSTADHRGTHGTGQEPVGELVSRASEQISQLMREELRLAQAEMTRKGKRFGIGGGLFGGATMIALLGLQALVATVIAVLALVLPLWASALVVTGVLFLLASVLAVAGKKQVGGATPPVPERAIDSVKADVAEIKERAHR